MLLRLAISTTEAILSEVQPLNNSRLGLESFVDGVLHGETCHTRRYFITVSSSKSPTWYELPVPIR
jgi:hypothetical protein